MKLTSQELQQIQKYMYSNFGIRLNSKKTTLIETRLAQTVLSKGFHSYGEYINFVIHDKSGKESTLLLNKLTTNHTYFLREKDHFDYLESVLLPNLFKQEQHQGDIRIWSAGCSSGQEAYTIAMFLQDFKSKHPEYAHFNTQVLATDISEQALQKGIKGIYKSDEINLPSTWINQYFHKKDPLHYQIKPALQQEIIFRRFNLMNTNYPFKKPFHVIFCRNVMIYFDNDSKRHVVQKFHQQLAPKGYLFIGQSEFITKADNPFHYVQPSIYQK